MIFDCHVHPSVKIPTATLLAEARRACIDRICLFSLGIETQESGDFANPTIKEVGEGNDIVLRAMAEHPEEIVGYCFVNPRHPEHALEEISRCVLEGPMIGVKLWISLRCSNPQVLKLGERISEMGLPVLAHCWNKATGNYEEESTTRDIAVLAAHCPELRIIAPHITGQGRRGLEEIAPHPNVFVDTSGGQPETGILEFAVRALGCSRVFYGSDYPGRGFSASLGRILGAKLSEEEKRQILGSNFLNFLNQAKSRQELHV